MRNAIPTDEQVRMIFNCAGFIIGAPRYSKFLEKTALKDWIDAAKPFNQINKWLFIRGAMNYINDLMHETVSILSTYQADQILNRHKPINEFSERLEPFNNARNELFYQYIKTPHSEPNWQIFFRVAQPFSAMPGAWRSPDLTELRSSDPAIQAFDDAMYEDARRWEQSPDGQEWDRHWKEFHYDMDRLLNDEMATAIERLRAKIDAAHRRIDRDLADDAPKALWRYQFAFDMCRYWRNLYGCLPGSNPDHPVVAFVEAVWHTVLECAEETISNPDTSKFIESDYKSLARKRSLLPKRELERWMSLNWERPIRSAVRKLRGKA